MEGYTVPPMPLQGNVIKFQVQSYEEARTADLGTLDEVLEQYEEELIRGIELMEEQIAKIYQRLDALHVSLNDVQVFRLARRRVDGKVP